MNILERIESKMSEEQRAKIDELTKPVKALLEKIFEKEPGLEADLDEIFKHRSELIGESDRGLCLLAVGKIDNVLSEILQIKILGSKKHKAELLGPNGPLGSLSSRLKVCYSLGILSYSHFREADTIRAIRNKFAHSDKPINFQSKIIKQLSNNLMLSKALGDNQSARLRFVSAHIFLLGRLIWIRRKAVSFESDDINLEDGAFDLIGSIHQIIPEILNSKD